MAEKIIPFTVASALLRELGERLVGQPHIALSELVKNAYDADARKVEINFTGDRIIIRDNGHGMDFGEFRDFWMRIGSPHKQNLRVSRNLGRPLTGSKGVGRLAVQFLAKDLSLHTVSERTLENEIRAEVDWETAVDQGDLTEAYALYEESSAKPDFPDDSPNGTTIELWHLNQQWTSESLVELAKEVWSLQPPFRSSAGRTAEQADFDIEFVGPNPEETEKFEDQMKAYQSIWHARLVGTLNETESVSPGDLIEGWPTRTVKLELEFSDGTRLEQRYAVKECPLDKVSFEIRAYYPQGRQKFGIKVGELRDYFNKYGGVYVYDSGFRLPYYGPDHDWLGIEIDHSHRLSKSKLLPSDLQVQEGMNYLPTNSRLFGVVHVDTSHERSRAFEARALLPSKDLVGHHLADHLDIQVTRDRLTDNPAYRKLTDIVRWALDYYAHQEARRRFEEKEAAKPVEPPKRKFQRVEQVLEQYAEAIPKPAYSTLKQEVREAVRASETESEAMASRVALLAPLATAGMAALAYEHEAARLFNDLESVIKEMSRLGKKSDDYTDSLAERLRHWLSRARASRGLFTYLLDEKNRETRRRFKVRAIIDDVTDQITPLSRGVKVETYGVDSSLRLPFAGYVQWSALFQNVLLNAVNAMVGAPTQRISVVSQMRGERRTLLVQDTGSGVALQSAEELFEPFERRTRLPPEWRQLGEGGSGLGLTIVRMIASEIGCEVGFVEPENGFNTAFSLSWKEKK